MKFILPALSAATVGALLSVSALAQPDFSEWNQNDDSTLSRQEWNQGMDTDQVFAKIDDNSNGTFEIAEADQDAFAYAVGMDLDSNDKIDEQEFTTALFDRHDTNDDDMLTEAEFMAFDENVASSDLFDE